MHQGASLGLQDMGCKMECITKAEDIYKISEEIARNKKVKAVYLFGSQVSGKLHRRSDIDICIITDGSEDVDYPCTDNLDVSFFHLLPLAVKYRVLKEGRQIIIKDVNFLHNLKIKTLNEYLDFLPFINKYLMERFGGTI